MGPRRAWRGRSTRVPVLRIAIGASGSSGDISEGRLPLAFVAYGTPSPPASSRDSMFIASIVVGPSDSTPLSNGDKRLFAEPGSPVGGVGWPLPATYSTPCSLLPGSLAWLPQPRTFGSALDSLTM